MVENANYSPQGNGKPLLIAVSGTELREQLQNQLEEYKIHVTSTFTEPSNEAYDVLDYRERNNCDVQDLVNELNKGYRASEIPRVLYEFNKSNSEWKHRSQLLRQRTDLQILEAILKNATPREVETHFKANFSTPEAQMFLDGLFEKYPWIQEQYQSKNALLAQDVSRIAKEHPMKLYLDMPHEKGAFWSVSDALIDKMLRRRIIESVPGRYFHIDTEKFRQELMRAAETAGHPPIQDLRELQSALGPAAEKIRDLLGNEEKLHVLKYLQDNGINGIVRREKRIPEASKNEVYKVDFEVSPNTAFKAVVKVFDRRNPATADIKRREFGNEVLAIRYFERVGLIDPIYFLEEEIDGISAIVMNYLPEENLLDLMRESAPQERFDLAKQMARMGARFHAFGPTYLAKQSLGETISARYAHFENRLIGEHGYFFNGILRLLDAQGEGVSAEDAQKMKANFAEGFEPLLTHLSRTKEFDTPYCDFWIPNWFARREGKRVRVKTKMDYGTLKIVPASIDLTTLYAVSDFVPEKHDEIARLFFHSYNHAVAQVNDVIKEIREHPRDSLEAQLRDDKRNREYAPRQVIESLLKKIPDEESKLQIDRFLDSQRKHFYGDQAAQIYLEEHKTYFESLSTKREPFKSEEDFLLLCKATVPKRAAVMAGFHADFAAKHGLEGKHHELIVKTLNNSVQALEELCATEHFGKSSQQIMKASETIKTLMQKIASLKPTERI